MTTASASNLGLIVRSDDSGLGNQTHNLYRLLSPQRLLIVDSYSFNQRPQHHERYMAEEQIISKGFITDNNVLRFLPGLNKVLTAETFYSHYLVKWANQRNIETYQMFNYEFCEHLHNDRLPLPYKWLAPSYWKLDEMKDKFGNVEYLPPPLFEDDFAEIRQVNKTRSRRYLHIIGRFATHDRNGTNDIINALQLTKSDFKLTIHSQEPINITNIDNRVQVLTDNLPDHRDIYKGYDALILPRRYGGLCLPMNEALMSGLPVIMPNIEPNNKILPSEWLVDAKVFNSFTARTAIDVYASDAGHLASKLDWLSNMSDDEMLKVKQQAFKLALKHYESETLRPEYQRILDL